MDNGRTEPVRIVIERWGAYPLRINEIKYVFQTLLTIAGIPWHFMPRHTSGTIDIYFGKKPPPDSTIRLFIEMTGNDIILSAFYLLSGCQEQFMRRDSRDVHRIEDSFLYRNGLLHTPIVNQYVLLIREAFRESHGFIPSWPGNKEFAVALSHDVDYPEMIRWIEAFRYVAKHRLQSRPPRIINIFKGRESFWRFEDWIRLEQKYNMKSAFYFCGFQGNLVRYFLKAPDPFYDIGQDRFKRIMNAIDENGFEVGMHSSYQAYRSADQFLEEKLRIEESLGKPIFGNRHHYWHMNPDDPSETALIHHRIGLVYDSSISFERCSGFRYGICSPFHLYDRVGNQPVPTLQLPPTLMDNHLFGHIKDSHCQGWRSHISTLLDAVRKHEGVFVADYHVRVLNATFYPEWGESYEYLLQRIIAAGSFYCDTPLNIARYWLDREQTIRVRSQDER